MTLRQLSTAISVTTKRLIPLKAFQPRFSTNIAVGNNNLLIRQKKRRLQERYYIPIQKKGYSSKPWKKTKGKYCNHCKKPGHSPHECFVLHPHLKRPQKKDSSNNQVKKSKPNKARKEREEKEKALIALVNALRIIKKKKLQKPLKPQIPDDQRLIEISEDENDEYDDVDFEDVEMVFTTTSIPKDLTNALSGLVEKLHGKGYFQKEGSKSSQIKYNEFILDNGATSHILKDKSSFVTYKEMNKRIHWGEAASLNILGKGTAYVKFKDTRKKRLLADVLHVTELGVNIISQSSLINNFTITTPNSCIICDIHTSEVLTTGKMKNGLYWLDIEIMNPKLKKQRPGTLMLTKATQNQIVLDTSNEISKKNIVPKRVRFDIEDQNLESQNSCNATQSAKPDFNKDFNRPTKRQKTMTDTFRCNTPNTTIKSLNDLVSTETDKETVELSENTPNSTINQNSDINQNSNDISSRNTSNEHISTTQVDLKTIHQRMGHINLKAIKRLAKDQNLTIKNNNSFRIDQCPECLEGKMISQKHKISLSNIKTIEYLDLVSSDICGPINPKTWDNYKYFITFLDKSTRFLEVILLKKKSEALNAFKVYKAKAENQSNKRIKRLRTDNGGEYVNTDFEYTLNKFGILHEKTAPYTKEPNGLIERVNLTLLNKVRSMIYTANLPRYL